VGDSLLSGAFMAYLGYFDQQMREEITSKWISHIKKANIPYNSNTTTMEYLTTPDDRLRWKQNSLPDDTLCTENAVMLRRAMRYPLIIDPSGQAIEFVMKEYADKKLAKTSFLDPNFRKSLESALRFGTPLLIQDAGKLLLIKI
jgi:dynein heavy chain 1